MSTDDDVSLPEPPERGKKCSAAGYEFQLRHAKVFEFLFFTSTLAARADETRYIAAKAISTVSKEGAAKWEATRKDPQPMFRRLQSHGDYLSEVIAIRSVDNFLSMLSETLQACMLKRPELLRSNEQVRTEDVLRLSNRRDLVDFLINRKLNDLSYGGLRGIEEFLESRLGLKLTETAAERALLGAAIELRNIYTHNRGVVNELMLSRLQGHPHGMKFVLGQRYHADFNQLVVLANNMFAVARRLDIAVISKFGLLAKRYSTWDAPRAEEEKNATVHGEAAKWFEERVKD